jgi:cytochrome c oxidase subunit 2
MCIEHSRRTRLAILLASVALDGCNGTTSYLDATGTPGRAEAVLGEWLLVASCVVVAVVSLALLVGIARRRGGGNEQTSNTTRREIRSGLGWIYVGIAATVVVLLVAFTGTMVTLDAASHPPRIPSLTLDVTAHQWWWEVRYGEIGHPELGFITANELHLPVGVPVRVRLHAADVIHSFWIPQLAGKTDVIPGQANEMWIEAQRAGGARGMCGEYCGLQHANMAFAVTAESPQQFEAWARARRAEAVAPTGAEAIRGATEFARTCGACHAVSGTLALGRVGPDLTHFASRPTIGAGVLENTPQNLARWITAAPAIKEGSRMPAIPLDSAQRASVVAYLATLR